MCSFMTLGDFCLSGIATIMVFCEVLKLEFVHLKLVWNSADESNNHVDVEEGEIACMEDDESHHSTIFFTSN